MTELTDMLARETGLRSYDLVRIMTTAPRRYKRYQIPKRSGGQRTIAQPAREVKLVQRALIRTLLANLPVHDAATAYRSGKSIRDNAQRHVGAGPILKLDLTDFFWSLRARDWVAYCHSTNCLTDATDIYLTSRLLFHDTRSDIGLRLAIGAPSSPALSNILMFEFDRRIIGAMENEEIVYTRYADDMTFSAPRTGYLNHVQKGVRHVIRGLKRPRLRLNTDKTTYVTKKYHRVVTGLTIANDARITIGRDKKRQVRAALHRAMHEKLSPEDLRVLAGILAYINAVEPDFIDVLRTKYGPEIIAAIQKAVVIGHGRLAPHTPPIARI